MKHPNIALFLLPLGLAAIGACTSDPSPSPAVPAPAPTPTSPSTSSTAALPAPSSNSRPALNAAGGCAAELSWVTNPSFPTEIPGGGQSLCSFQQFAWQDFLALVQPVAGTSDLVFETWMTKEGVFQPETYEPGRTVPFAWGASLPVPKECKTEGEKSNLARSGGGLRGHAGSAADDNGRATNGGPVVGTSLADGDVSAAGAERGAAGSVDGAGRADRPRRDAAGLARGVPSAGRAPRGVRLAGKPAQLPTTWAARDVTQET